MADDTDVLATSAAWVNIDLDRPRKVRFRHNDLADMEALTGRGFDQLMTMRFHGARIILQYGLRWMDKSITAEQAGNLIQDHWLKQGKTYKQFTLAVTKALVAGGILPPNGAEQAQAAVDAEAAELAAVADGTGGGDEGNAPPDAPAE